jgi:hypothetical protein
MCKEQGIHDRYADLYFSNVNDLRDKGCKPSPEQLDEISDRAWTQVTGDRDHVCRECYQALYGE